MLKAVLIRKVTLPETVAQRVEQKIEAKQEAERMEFVIDRERLEADRRVIEAEGISEANKVIAESLTREYLQWHWIQSLENHDSVLYVPVGNNGMPLFKNVDVSSFAEE